MERRDLVWLDETLPRIVGSVSGAEFAVEQALLASSTNLTAAAFWEFLGSEIADALQARWAFGEITLEHAIALSHELAAHLLYE